MNFRAKLYKGIKIAIFFTLVFLILGVATKVMQRKDSIEKYKNFFEMADQIDVLFLGSSHVMNSINPVQLYAEKGITSYNMSKHGGMLTESYWTLVNALDYVEPKCVVVDLWALDRDYHYLDVMNGFEPKEDTANLVSMLHNNMDMFPLSKNKIVAINDLIKDPEIRKEFYWDFTLYHDRWSRLSQKDFDILEGKVNKNELLGAMRITEHDSKIDLYQPEDIGECVLEDTVCLQYLYKILDLCEERGIQAVLTFLPMASSYEQDWQAVNTGYKIQEERGVPFIDMLPHETQSVIDYYTDMCDDTHVNSNGMRKITSYIGEFLAKNMNLEDHRNDPAYIVWAEKVNLWQQGEIELLFANQNLYQKLGQIQNTSANVVIFMPGGSQALQDILVRRYIKQLTGTTVVDEAATVTGPYLYIRDTTDVINSGVKNIEFAGEVQPDVFSSILGDVTYLGLNNFGAVYVDGDLENNYLDMEKYYLTEMQILILDENGGVIQHFVYDPAWDDMRVVE